jgi:uncharacterized membrane protein YadS
MSAVIKSPSRLDGISLSPPRWNEDGVALVIGLLIFALALGALSGTDLLGWVVTTSVWTDIGRALGTAGKSYAGLGGAAALLLTYGALLAVLSGAAWALRLPVARFALSFSLLFVLAYGCWVVGSFGRLAVVTVADRQKFGLDWSLRLTNEGGYLVALLLGLAIANFWPRLALFLREAIRPELYIKIAIVILGAFLAVTAAGKLNLASNLLLRGVAAIIEAYLIYWPVVYLISRKYFGFSREWSAPLASGISICGVAAAIATGGAIRARPVVPVLVSSLVVIFAVVEVLILPWLAQQFLSDDPLVAGAWIGLAIKTDGAAVAAGGITDALITARAGLDGVHYQPGWILATSSTVKVFIDIFIGIWAFILGSIWTNVINPAPAGQRTKAIEIWQRFPKFIIGFVVTFGATLLVALYGPAPFAQKLPAAIGEANNFRVIFFLLTFFSIGLLSNFAKLWQEGFAKLVAVYLISLFGFVIWVGLAISWIFFHGVLPPLAN